MAETSARADRQQNFFAEGVLKLLKLQRRLAFIAQDFEHGWATLFRYFHATILKMDHVHLQRLDLKVPVVAAIWTGQRHELFPFRRFIAGCGDQRYLKRQQWRASGRPLGYVGRAGEAPETDSM